MHIETLQSYDPDNLLTSLIHMLKLKNDAALSRALEVAPPVISKIRHRRLPVGASMPDSQARSERLEHQGSAFVDGRPAQQVSHQRPAVQAEGTGS